MATAAAQLQTSASPAAIATAQQDTPPAVTVDSEAPVKKINSQVVRQLGLDLKRRFETYAQDRQLQEQKFLRNLRQYLGIYDPEVESQLPRDGSRAYPRLTRVKCISMLSRVMNLMFPGNEKNWELGASPSAEMSPEDVKQAVLELMQEIGQQQGQQPQLSQELVQEAVNRLARQRAATLEKLIEDQMAEIGGDQTLDYISLVRQVVFSGIRYGLGVLEGPYLREEKKIMWSAQNGGYQPVERTIRKPIFEWLSVWDYYPDFSAKSLTGGEGYFVRKIMGRSDVRKLADRPDFFADQIKDYLRRDTTGNYKAKSFEQDLKVLGTKANVNELRTDPHNKYEIIVWKGPISAQKLREVGATIPEGLMADDIEAEVWMIEGTVIKADVNAWRKMGVSVRTVHTFIFDEDDTSIIGNGLPNVCRDSQMSLCAAVRMALDNASVTCGPNVEVNVALLRPGQDTSSVHAYKVWERDDDGLTAQFPAVREVQFDSHLEELTKLVEMFSSFADMETFIGPATGGDMDKMPSEPMRTAAGASMMKGDAALPFKDIIRNFDFFTQSVILSLVHFNRKFNPQIIKEGDYDVIARGATSLIAKEVRGMQTDVLAQTLTPEDRDWIDEEQFIHQRMATRDMTGLMVPKEIAMRNRAQRMAAQAEMSDLNKQLLQAEIRKTLSDAFKAITQGQKNTASADATTSNAALDILERGLEPVSGNEGTTGRAQSAAN
jgi:hypothetical protein